MKYIDKKVNPVIHTIVNDQPIRFQITNKVPVLYKIMMIFSIIVATELLFFNFWNASFPYLIDFYSDLLYCLLFIGFSLFYLGFYIDKDSEFLFTENRVVRLRRISALIKKNPRLKEIKYKDISFITFKEKNNLLKSINIYERDENFPSLSIDAEKIKLELELLENKLKKFQILFNIKRDVDHSKKIFNYLIQEASLERHPILRNVYFA